MTKLYSKKNNFLPKPKLNPKKETISFLLQYSRLLTIIETPLGKFAIVLN